MSNEIEVMEDIEESIKRHFQRVDRHNKRRIELLSRFKTKRFIKQIRELMEDGVHSLCFVRTTERGKKQKSDYSAIKWEWVDQYTNGGYLGDEYAGYIYVQVKPDRFLRMQYEM